MFTGIVEELGTVRAIAASRLEVGCRLVLEGTDVGDSVSVNGCCLTVTALDPDGFATDLMAETLVRTSLGRLRPGDRVNLERAVAASDRLGGHLVQGHVDAAVEVLAVDPAESWTALRLRLPPELAGHVAEKGSVALDGVSLTVTGVEGAAFTVGLIPHTLAHTTLGAVRPGAHLNLETDVIAKYVERLLTARKG